MAEDTASALLGVGTTKLQEEKKTEDYSMEAELMIKRVDAVRKSGGLRISSSEFDELLALEKKCRQAQDASSGARLCEFYVSCLFSLYDRKTQKQLYLSAADDVPVDPFDPKTMAEVDCDVPDVSITFLDGLGVDMFCQQLLVLIKKRGQLKRSTIAVVKIASQVVKYLKLQQKRILIETIDKATEGKMFVEVERARLILVSALMKEKTGQLQQAALLLQDVQVETFGAMDRHEKTRYLLKQMQLLLGCEDYIRCHIVSRKINVKLLEADDMQELKIQYFQFMVRYHLHEQQYIDAAKACQSCCNTKTVQQNTQQLHEFMECFILFLVLAPYNQEREDMMKKLVEKEFKKLQELPIMEQMLHDLLRAELLAWPLSYEDDLKPHFLFTDEKYEDGEKRWTLLRKRVLQHNLRVISQHYSVIRLQRIASLLGISIEEAETELAESVCDGFVVALIDRPALTVTFGADHGNLGTLDNYASQLGSLLGKIDVCWHMIQKERMIHAARAKASTLAAKAAK